MEHEVTIATRVKLTSQEVCIAMLSIYGFSQKDMEAITKLSVARIKQIVKVLCVKLHGENSGNMAFHAQNAGFKLNGTVKGKDIFTEEMKAKIKALDPDVEFRKKKVGAVRKGRERLHAKAQRRKGG